MYARRVLFTIGPGNRPFADQMMAKFDPALRSVPGFVDVTFFGDDDTGEYGSLVFWANKEAADAAFGSLNTELESSLEGKLIGELRHPLFEVIEP